MKKQWILFSLLIFCGCSQLQQKKSYAPSEKQVLVNKVRKKVASDLENKYGLIPCGTGGQMMYQIEKLMLIFNYPKPLTEDEARVLVVNAVDEFVASVNQEEAIHQYLANYPFRPENVEVTIFLQDSRGKRVQPDRFIFVEAAAGRVVYKADDPETNRYRIVHKETFEEAKALLQKTGRAAI